MHSKRPVPMKARAVCSKGSTPVRSPRFEGGPCAVKRVQCAILLSMGKLLLRRFIGGCFKSHSSDRAVRVTATFRQLPVGSMGRRFSFFLSFFFFEMEFCSCYPGWSAMA